MVSDTLQIGRAQARAILKERRRARKAGEIITVSSPVSLKFVTKTKLHSLGALLREVRGCVRRYIKVCWKNPEAALDAKTLNLVSGGSLSYRHRSNALKIALDTISSTRKSASTLGVKPSRPVFGKTAAVPLCNLLCKIEPSKDCVGFDYIVKIAGLVKGHKILLPVKSHKHLNKWLEDGKLLNSIVVTEDTAILQIEVALGIMRTPTPETTLGVDLGYLKLLSTSDGDFHGTKMKAVTDRVRRSKPGSKGRLRASRARTHYINRQVNELPWDSITAIGLEDLTGIKQGKKGALKQYKSFRKKMASWVHRQATKRIEFKAKVNRVHDVSVDPRDSSRTCPPCGKVAKENRRGEVFRCICCNYMADADYVGAQNILVRTRGQLAGVYGTCASSKSDGDPLGYTPSERF